MLKKVLVALLLMTGGASGAEITTHDLPGGAVIRVSGDFNLYDDKKFVKAALQYDRAIVIFGQSNGGSLDAAIAMGRAIKLMQLYTSVATNVECASACAYAWLAGHKRFMEPGAKVGFHAVSRGGRTSGSGNAMLGAYLNELHLGMEAIAYLTDADPHSMTWLDKDGLHANGIDVGILAATEIPQAPKITTSLWEHNGSKVTLEAMEDNSRRFLYETPDSDVPVTKGTLLFKGTKNGLTYSGTAYVFSKQCPPVAYDVSGPVSADQNLITMFGKAPILSDCRQVSSRDDVLVFRYLQQEPHDTESVEWKSQAGIDLYGFDLQSNVPTDSAETCQRMCASLDSCRAYTFNMKVQRCFLKDNAEIAYKNVAAVSGYRTALDRNITAMPFTISEGWDWPGSDYRNLKGVKFDNCLKACERDSACKAFSYVSSKKQCWLKTGTKDAWAARGVVSGIKE